MWRAAHPLFHILELSDTRGDTHYLQAKILEILLNFYQHFYQQPVANWGDPNGFLKKFPFLKSLLASLNVLVSIEDIIRDIKAVKGNKAPGQMCIQESSIKFSATTWFYTGVPLSPSGNLPYIKLVHKSGFTSAFVID